MVEQRSLRMSSPCGPLARCVHNFCLYVYVYIEERDRWIDRSQEDRNICRYKSVDGWIDRWMDTWMDR